MQGQVTECLWVNVASFGAFPDIVICLGLKNLPIYAEIESCLWHMAFCSRSCSQEQIFYVLSATVLNSRLC